MFPLLASVAATATAAAQASGSSGSSASSSSSLLVLDPSIRDWVLLPIFIVMFGQGLLRQYLTFLMRDEKVVQVDALRTGQTLRRSQRLRAYASFLPWESWRARRKFMLTHALADPSTKPPRNNNNNNKDGEEGEESSSQASPAQQQDPMAMVGMMKQNLMTVLPNMLMMGWVSYFFSGFVLVKLPFPLTDRFKSMLQRGISLQNLDVSYVSSLSWFFINLFGLRGVFSLVLGADNGAVDNAQQMMQAQMAMGTGGMMGGPGAPPDPAKLFATERNEIEITTYQPIVAQVESRLLNIPILA